MIGCLRTRVHNQPIIALYFESENVLKLYNLEARSKVQDIPETFFVTYHQGTIVKSSQLLQNMVLNTHRVVRLGYYHHR